MKKVKQSCFKHPKVYGESCLLDINNVLMFLKNHQCHAITIMPTTLHFFYSLHSFNTGEVVKVYWRHLVPRHLRRSLFPYPHINSLIKLKMDHHLELINCEFVKGMENVVIEQRFDLMQTEMLRYQFEANKVDFEAELKGEIKKMVQRYLQRTNAQRGA